MKRTDPRPTGAVGGLVSGGQTGVDRATLDVALRFGIPCGGWCPAGRGAEDGRIADRYPLRETPSPDPAQRTAWNVRDSDATLIVVRGEPAGGTATTVAEAERQQRPYLVVDLDAGVPVSIVAEWIRVERVERLNVAGPRESECPGIYHQAYRYLGRLLRPVWLRNTTS